MCPNGFKVIRGQVTGFVEDLVRNTNFTDVVQEAGSSYPLDTLRRVANVFPNLYGMPAYFLGVAICIGIFGVNSGCESVYRVKICFMVLSFRLRAGG